MKTRERLKELCRPISNDSVYFRPFICKGKFEDTNIFLVGINPATPIDVKDISIDDYANLICEYERFMEYYKDTRRKLNISELSKTRLGINSFVNWIERNNLGSVLETNIYSYPTKDEKELLQQPVDILQKAKNSFIELLLDRQPINLIVHSKSALMNLVEILRTLKEISITMNLTINQRISELIHLNPVIEFKYMNSQKTCRVLFCRHFMYYGKKGLSYQALKDQLLNYIQY